jgi:multidrug resistance efflux pump
MGRTTRRRLTAALWITGAVVALGWGALRGQSVDVRGQGQARTQHVAALQTGRLAALEVGLHDPVVAGTVLAHMDDDVLVREQKLLQAEIDALQAELQSDNADRSRRFAEAREGANLDLAEVAADLAEDRARLAAVRENLVVEQRLADQGASSTLAVDTLRWQVQVIEARVRAGQSRLQSANRARGGTTERADALLDTSDLQLAAAERRWSTYRGDWPR